MNKKEYITPRTEVITLESYLLMEAWSIGISNDPNESIGAGEENDIGAKRDMFDDWGALPGNMWKD
ncbi:MAG TPA: hypothetical protein VIQ97_04935 [Prevotella sp.]